MSATRKHNIVAVDNWIVPPPFDFDYDLKQYERTSQEEFSERVKDCTILIVSGTAITKAGIESAPNLELIAYNGAGTDHIDLVTARERGVSVCRVPAQNADSVSEHAFALYYAVRRHIVDMHGLAMEGKLWAERKMVAPMMGQPPRTNAEETLVVVGYGNIGQRIERIGKALGMTVLVAERKGASEVRKDRTAFDEAIKQGTIFMVVAPLDNDTRDAISELELQAMDSTALVVNVGRGGVINEAALAKALKDGQIAGAATDVFEHEPATKENCPLLDDSIPNMILSPHVAWYSSRTIKGTLATVKANVEGFVAGKPQNLVVDGKGS